jgi:hypothetical protein
MPETPADRSDETPPNSDLNVTHGPEAVELLEGAGALEDVAADVGLEPSELVDELLDDPSLFVADTGEVGYLDMLGHDHDHDHDHGDDDHGDEDDIGEGHRDEGHAGEDLGDDDGATLAAGGEQLAGSAGAIAPTPAALVGDVFALDSQPSATRVLYLDFDGHATNDPDWARVTGAPTIVSAPFDLDGDPGSFSAAEQAAIFEVWQRMAEDYRPFDVNVTTRATRPTATCSAPGRVDELVQRVVVTPSNFTGNAGVVGVALLNSFASGADRPAYVFTDTPQKRTTKWMGEAASHEAGHTFGLRHDGDQTNAEYYEGHGAWAPIMGRPLRPDRPVTQWSRGEYAGANRQEDDLAIIAQLVGYRADDHGDTTSSATVVPAASTTVGNVGRTGDRDVFAVDVVAGQLGVRLQPPPGQAGWSNLAASVTIRDSAGGVVAASGPSVPSGWIVELAPVVAAGRYFVEVAPVPWLTPSDGFSIYGSLGAYELTVAAGQGSPPPGVSGSTFSPVIPVRLVDTRNGVGAAGRLAPCRQIVVPVTGRAGVPAGATAAVVNVAAVNASAPGFVTVHPCLPSVPNTSTLNFVGGQTVANTTIAALSGAGQLCVWTSADTDILVDITGWLGSSGTSRLSVLGPVRVVDTRSGVGGGRLPGGWTMSVDFNGVVPPGSTAVAVNVTGVTASGPGFLTVFPCGPRPNTSTVNYVAGEARPNNTIVGLSGGRICIYSDQDTEILVDLLGAFGPTGLGYLPTAPVRVLDTRPSSTLGPGGAASYGVGATALAGQTPGAAFVNVTGANHLVPGYLTTYDCATRRDTSTVNNKVGQAAANGAIVPLSGLQSCVWTFGGGDVIVDLNGWWVP